ncbi:MAG: hypothetical protein DHS20C13_29840 [Thermodesulfobacteriota bacterium]|nr:MAG: hypothetical protein DHS20C13_29840 [Thermodesulfobacteriota bacterium]
MTTDPLPAPGAPTGLTVDSSSYDSVSLSWTPADTFEDGFEVLRDEGGVEISIANLAAGTSTYDDNSVSPDTTYSYRIQASNSSGDSFSN